MASKLQQLVSLTSLDRSGRINMDSLLDVVAGAIDPVLADSILQPAEQAQQQMVKDVTDDLTKIFAGIEMPARPNGAQIALQVIQQYTAQEDIAARLQQDESFAARLEKYAGQYTFMMQQAQNAQIGRIGTAPAQMGGMQTQQM
jgi:aminopeptidase N